MSAPTASRNITAARAVEVPIPVKLPYSSTTILGDKTGLDPELKDIYQKSGMAHLLA